MINRLLIPLLPVALATGCATQPTSPAPPASPTPPGSPPALFRSVTTDVTKTPGAPPAYARHRYAEVNFKVLQQSSIGSRITLNLFADPQFQLWDGYVEGSPFSTATFTYANGRLRGIDRLSRPARSDPR